MKKIVALAITAALLVLASAAFLMQKEIPAVVPPPPNDRIPFHGSFNMTGGLDAEATTEDETVNLTLPVSIPQENLTAVEFSIKITDGDDNTNPDEVKKLVVLNQEMEADLSPGVSPYTISSNHAVSEEQSQNNDFLLSAWEIQMTVLCRASDDQWPGPLIWRGYPDYGFSYEVVVSYTYLASQPEPA